MAIKALVLAMAETMLLREMSDIGRGGLKPEEVERRLRALNRLAYAKAVVEGRAPPCQPDQRHPLAPLAMRPRLKVVS